MQQMETNVGRWQLDDTPEPTAGVTRMNADDDDKADQQYELADPGMAETDRSVLETT